MRKNPGRKQRRRKEKRKGDLNRRKTHKMRSKMGMGTLPLTARIEPKQKSLLKRFFEFMKSLLTGRTIGGRKKEGKVENKSSY